MKAVLICAVVLLLLILFGQIRIGVRVLYQNQGPAVWLKLGSFRKQVFPTGSKKEKPKKKVVPADKPGRPDEKAPALGEKVGGALVYAKALLPVVIEAVSHFKEKLRINELRLELTAGGTDPADAAMIYGHAMAVLGTFWYPITEAFHVIDGSAKVNLDFDAKEMTVFADATLTLKIGQALWLALCFGLRGLQAFLSVRSNQKKQVRKAA